MLYARDDQERDRSPSQRVRWTRLQVQMLVVLQLVFVFDGIDMQIMAMALPSIVEAWQLPLSAFALAMAAGHAGSFVGAPLAGVIADRVGRRPVIIGGVLLFGVMTLLLAVARDPQQLTALRFVAGLGLGGCIPPALALVTETMPPQRRGMSIALSMVCTPIGLAVAGLLSKWLIPSLGWQALFVVCGLCPPGIALLLAAFVPESPQYLALRGDRQVQLARLLARLGLDQAPPRRDDVKLPCRAAFGVVFARRRRLGVAGLFASFFCTYVAMALMLGWLPSMMGHYGYAHAIAATAISVFSLAGILGVILTGWVITARGEWTAANLLLGGGAAAALAIAAILPPPQALPALTVPLAALLVVLGMTMNGVITALYTRASAMFPASVRSSGIGLASMVGRIGAMAGGLVGPAAIGGFGAGGFFAVLGALLALGMAAANLRSGGAAMEEPAGIMPSARRTLGKA